MIDGDPFLTDVLKQMREQVEAMERSNDQLIRGDRRLRMTFVVCAILLSISVIASTVAKVLVCK